MTARTDDPRHAKLEDDVAEFLDSMGFLHDAATYHAAMRPEVVKRLQGLDTPTSLYLRGRADRVAVHKTLPICFEWECKTKAPRWNDSRAGNGVDLTVEALPLAHHVMKSRLGVRALYVYRDEFQNIECGFWNHQLPPIRDLWVTPRGDGIKNYLFTVWPPDCFKYVFREVRNSNDPFVVFERSVILGLRNWRDQIGDLIANADTVEQLTAGVI